MIDFISVNPTNGAIDVSALSTSGTYKIKVVGKLPNNQEVVQEFSLIDTIINKIPYFNPVLKDINAPLGKSTVYSVPVPVDLDVLDTPIFMSASMTSTPSFYTYDTALK